MQGRMQGLTPQMWNSLPTDWLTLSFPLQDYCIRRVKSEWSWQVWTSVYFILFQQWQVLCTLLTTLPAPPEGEKGNCNKVTVLDRATSGEPKIGFYYFHFASISNCPFLSTLSFPIPLFILLKKLTFTRYLSGLGFVCFLLLEPEWRHIVLHSLADPLRANLKKA